MMFISVDLPQPDGPTMATNSPSPTLKLTPSTHRQRALVRREALRDVVDVDLSAHSATCTDFEPFEQAHHAVEQQADQADDDHAGDHQVVAVAGVARVDDQVAEAGAQRDHLRRDHDQPGDAEADAHADDDLRQHRGDHDPAEQRRSARRRSSPPRAGSAARSCARPTVVCTIIGNTDEMKIRKIGEALPTPNQRIAIGIQAIGEIGRSIWKIGFSVVNAPRTQPIHRPSGTATSDGQHEAGADAEQRRADVLPQRAVLRPARSVPVTTCHGVGKIALSRRRDDHPPGGDQQRDHRQRRQRPA